MPNRTGEIALTAALGVAAGAFLAGPARKLAMQGAEAVASKYWLDALTKEHRMVQKAFDKLFETTERDVAKRKAIIMGIDHALTKHTMQEEKVIYPALKRVDAAQARHLFEGHADVNTMISELQFNIDHASPMWLQRARELRAELDKHMREEEDEIFPAFRERMSEEENVTLTRNMHWTGMKVA
jgi:hemerythrin superfamily protein